MTGPETNEPRDTNPVSPPVAIGEDDFGIPSDPPTPVLATTAAVHAKMVVTIGAAVLVLLVSGAAAVATGMSIGDHGTEPGRSASSPPPQGGRPGGGITPDDDTSADTSGNGTDTTPSVEVTLVKQNVEEVWCDPSTGPPAGAFTVEATIVVSGSDQVTYVWDDGYGQTIPVTLETDPAGDTVDLDYVWPGGFGNVGADSSVTLTLTATLEDGVEDRAVNSYGFKCTPDPAQS